jgi:hypothetical protein
VITIPIYKWDHYQGSTTGPCWLENNPHPDLWVTLAAIIVISLVNFSLTVINCHIKKELIGLNMTLNDYWSTIVNVVVLSIAAICATVANSPFGSTVLNVIFCIFSTLLALTLFFAYRRLQSKGLDAQITTHGENQQEPWGTHDRSTDRLTY